MKLQELNADEMKKINGGNDYPIANEENQDGEVRYSDGQSYPVSDGVGQTNQSTYGNPDGPVRHHIP